MNKTKVCHLTSAHGAFDDRIYHKECKSLQKAGYDVTIIAQYDNDTVIDGIKFVALNKTKSRLYRVLGLPLQTLLKALKEKAQIYHFHDPELLPICVLLKLISVKSIIYDVHEDYGKQVLSKPYLSKISRKVLSVFIDQLEYVSTKFYDGVITATDDICNKFTSHKRAVSVKNYPQLSYFQDTDTEINQSGLNTQAYNLVYIGNVSKERGLLEMIESLKYMDASVTLHIFGDVSTDNLSIDLNKLKEFERVKFHGLLPHSKVLELLSEFDAGIVCLHPLINYITALPIKLFEYMAAGLPVIASDFPILREIVEGNKCGYCVDPLDPAEIAKASMQLMNDKEQSRTMGENGKRAVLQKYNWESESNILLETYKDILLN